MPIPSRETTVAVPGVVGRDAELTRLARLLSRAGLGSAAVAVILGETGCGKTHLLNTLVERARADGWKCLNVQGVESEAVLSGAGLLSVLSPLRGGLGSVPEAQAEALSAALGWGPASGSGDRFLVGAATLSLLAAESAHGPLLIAVDDVQWVDVESADALAFAARRLGHDRVAVVMTHRVGTPLLVPLDGFDTREARSATTDVQYAMPEHIPSLRRGMNQPPVAPMTVRLRAGRIGLRLSASITPHSGRSSTGT